MGGRMASQRLAEGLKRLFIIFLLVMGIAGGVGLIIYALYRVATLSKSIYAIIFYSALFGLIVFYVFKGIQKKLLVKVFLRIARVLMKIAVIVCIVSAVLLYGAFVVRHPIGGGIMTPFLITLLITGGLRFKLFSFLNKIFS
jgi:hypothetical protein